MAVSLDQANFIAIGIMETLGLISLLWLINFSRLIKVKEIKARKPKSSFIAGILNTFSNLIVYPFVLTTLNMKSVSYIPYIPVVNNFIITLCSTGVYHIFTFRAWMVYFDIKFNKALEHNQWRLFIDPQEKNWFLKNRNKWGNPKRIATILCINFSVFALGGIIVVVMNGGKTNVISRLLVLLSALPPFVCDIIIYFKFPKFHDLFGVANEIKMTLRTELLQILIYYPVGVLLNAQYYSYNYIILLSIGSITAFIFELIMRFRVFKVSGLPTLPFYTQQFANNRSNLDAIMDSQPYDYSARSASQDMSNRHNSIDNVSKVRKQSAFRTNMAMINVLQDKHGFNSFACHLTKEFCLENLLFFLETSQWKQSLQEKINYRQFKMETKMNVQFPITAPKSRIIQATQQKVDENVNIEMAIQNNGIRPSVLMDINGNVIASTKKHFSDNEPVEEEKVNNLPSIDEYLQSVRLFKKYIPDSAYFGLNIASETRLNLFVEFRYDRSNPLDEGEMVKILNEIRKMNQEELFHVFDTARKEIFLLLKYAFTRFKASESFAKLSKTLTIQYVPSTSDIENEEDVDVLKRLI